MKKNVTYLRCKNALENKYGLSGIYPCLDDDKTYMFGNYELNIGLSQSTKATLLHTIEHDLSTADTPIRFTYHLLSFHIDYVEYKDIAQKAYEYYKGEYLDGGSTLLVDSAYEYLVRSSIAYLSEYSELSGTELAELFASSDMNKIAPHIKHLCDLYHTVDEGIQKACELKDRISGDISAEDVEAIVCNLRLTWSHIKDALSRHNILKISTYSDTENDVKKAVDSKHLTRVSESLFRELPRGLQESEYVIVEYEKYVSTFDGEVHIAEESNKVHVMWGQQGGADDEKVLDTIEEVLAVHKDGKTVTTTKRVYGLLPTLLKQSERIKVKEE